MINIIILLLIIALYKIFVLVGCGYYTFRKVDRPDCFASEESEKPTSKRIDESGIRSAEKAEDRALGRKRSQRKQETR